MDTKESVARSRDRGLGGQSGNLRHRQDAPPREPRARDTDSRLDSALFMTTCTGLNDIDPVGCAPSSS